MSTKVLLTYLSIVREVHDHIVKIHAAHMLLCCLWDVNISVTFDFDFLAQTSFTWYIGNSKSCPLFMRDYLLVALNNNPCHGICHDQLRRYKVIPKQVHFGIEVVISSRCRGGISNTIGILFISYIEQN